MEHTPKKPAFEPVSDEEAKKIRASSGRYNDLPPSGLECSSATAYDACSDKGENAWCCNDVGNRYYGKCQYVSQGSGSDLPRQLKCVEIPGVFPGGKKL